MKDHKKVVQVGRFVAVFLALMDVLALAGCGGSSGAQSSGSLLSMDIEAQTFTREHPFEQPS